jgi:DNA-binding transcriptional LysR family regulator
VNDPLSGIAVFVEVAKAGSFARAAERLGLTKSGVSKAITRLEQRLGDNLFVRSTRGLTLTVSGETYLASCLDALDILRATEEELGGKGGAPRGRLRIDMPAAFGRRVLVPLLAEICLENPHLQLTLSFNDRRINPVEEGVDLVVRFGRSKDAAGLTVKTLAEQPRYICASPQYIERHGAPAILEDLARHACLVGFRRGAPERWTVCVDGAERRIDPPPTHRIGDGDAIVTMALAGMGLCQMPAVLLREHLADGRLVPVLEDVRGPDLPVQLVWPGTRQASPRVRFLIDRLVELARAGRLG